MSLPPELEKARREIEAIARDYGLDFFPVVFELVSYKQMHQLAAYTGFPVRYPHWRWGMEYERVRKSYTYGLQVIHEMVINNNPCYAYLLSNNTMLEHKMVMAHVYAHADFFKNNQWFAHTNRKMLDEMANHAVRVQRYIERYGEERVESFIDLCLSIEDMIDFHAAYVKRYPAPDEDESEDPEAPVTTVPRLPSKSYLDKWVNPPEFLEELRQLRQRRRQAQRKFPPRPEKDLLLFLLQHAPLEEWQRDILSIIREESYYFAPQMMTKILNEGWACVVGDTLVFTDRGLLPMRDIVAQKLPVRVQDGKEMQRVYDWAHFVDRQTVWVRTKRGLELEGSTTHHLLMADGSWKSLGEVVVGDRVRISGGQNLWAKEYVAVRWRPVHRLTLERVAELAGVHPSTVIRFRKGRHSVHADRIAPVLAVYEEEMRQGHTNPNHRQRIKVPKVVDERLAAFLGYLIGDGHISERKRVVGFTNSDGELAFRFASLGERLFGIQPRCWQDGSRWRVNFYAQDLIDLLKHLGLPTGMAARQKTVPPVILCSPQSVVVAFLRALFVCDADAGESGVIFSTSSEKMGKVMQLLLLNFGILSARRRCPDGCWQVQIAGKSALTFEREIGFGLERKRQALRRYLAEHLWFKEERWDDEIVAVERRRADVYDISVTKTHRYVAAGFINHNSFWHSKIMTERVLKDEELIDYADRHAAVTAAAPGVLNPYKLGLELLRDIKERWDKGRFGKEYEECDDLALKEAWDKGLGLGMAKLFEVRRVHNDVTFIDAFLTEEFVRKHKLFTYDFNRYTGAYEISSRQFETVKQKLLFLLTNCGRPIIWVVDGNYRNRGELYLWHQHEGVDLRWDYAVETTKNIHALWKRPVHLETVKNGRRVRLSVLDKDRAQEEVL
jgi:stage V sporulation protein R